MARRGRPPDASDVCAPPDEASAVFPVHVIPSASVSEIVGTEGGVLRVRVAAPPFKDKANRALVKLLAKTLGVANGQVEILRGHKTRRKTVRVYGVKTDAIVDLMRPTTRPEAGQKGY